MWVGWVKPWGVMIGGIINEGWVRVDILCCGIRGKHVVVGVDVWAFGAHRGLGTHVWAAIARGGLGVGMWAAIAQGGLGVGIWVGYGGCSVHVGMAHDGVSGVLGCIIVGGT